MKDSMLDGLTIDDVINSVSDTETDNDTVFESLNKQKMFTLLQSMEEDKSIYELSIHEILDKLGLTWVDKRDKKGALWVIGDNSINDVFEFLKKHGFRFTFSAKGGRASKNMPAWFSTTTGNKLSENGGTGKNFKIIKYYGILTNKRRPICVNYMQWYNNPPSYDIREWDSDRCEKPGKGISLSKEDIINLRNVLSVDVISEKEELLNILKLDDTTVDDYGIVAELSSRGKWHIEARILDWGYKKGLDIRSWNTEHTQCGRGINIKQDDLTLLIPVLQEIEE